MRQDWGFSQLSYSNGAAYGDLDNDGGLAWSKQYNSDVLSTETMQIAFRESFFEK